MPNDNRIRFDAPLIDFAGTVGLSGQTHDNYPAPNTQARYDHLRMYLIGLLSCQSSDSQPTEYREGTWWFDTTINMMKIYSNGAWKDASHVIRLGTTTGGDAVTLQDWYDTVGSAVQSLQSEICFQSSIVSFGVTLIPIPGQLQPLVISGSRAFVTVNGVAINPLITTLEPGTIPTAVKVPVTLNIGDKISIIIKFIPSTRFFLTEQTV